MSKADKIFEKLTSGQGDANFSFDEIRTLLTRLGYTARSTKGSHIIFQREGGSFLNLQLGHGGKAKSYQVRRVRDELKNRNLRP